MKLLHPREALHVAQMISVFCCLVVFQLLTELRADSFIGPTRDATFPQELLPEKTDKATTDEYHSLHGLTLFFTEKQRNADVGIVKKLPVRKNPERVATRTVSKESQPKTLEIQYSARLSTSKGISVIVNELPCRAISGLSSYEHLCPNSPDAVSPARQLSCPHLLPADYGLCLAGDMRTLAVIVPGKAVKKLQVGDQY